VTALTHQVVSVLPNNPAKEVSSTAWNQPHLLPGTIGQIFASDGTSGIAPLPNMVYDTATGNLNVGVDSGLGGIFQIYDVQGFRSMFAFDPVNGNISADKLIPAMALTGLLDLGLPTNLWKDGWFAGTVDAAGFSISGTPLAIPTITAAAGQVLVGDGAGNAVGDENLTWDSGNTTVAIGVAGTTGVVQVFANCTDSPFDWKVSLLGNDPSVGSAGPGLRTVSGTGQEPQFRVGGILNYLDFFPAAVAPRTVETIGISINNDSNFYSFTPQCFFPDGATSGDNAIDLGSSGDLVYGTVRWRTGYFGTSVVVPLVGLGGSADLTLDGTPKLTQIASGAGTAALGVANCPASVLSAPYRWLTMKAEDGSTIYVPGWK